MNKNTVIILVLLFCVICSCSRNKQPKPSVYELELLKTNKIILNEKDRNTSYNYFISEIDGRHIIIVCCDDNRLMFFDIENGKKIHELYTDSNKKIGDYKYINKDSIFIYYQQSHSVTDDIEIPGRLQLVDFNGNIKKNYHFNNIDTVGFSQRNLEIEKCLPPKNISNFQEGLTIFGNIIYFSTYYGEIGEVGTKEFMENRLPMFIAYDLETETFKFSTDFAYPYVEEGIYYPTLLRSEHVVMSSKGMPLMRYIYSSNVFEYDYKNDKINTHSIKSRLFDTVMPLNEPSYYKYTDLGVVYNHLFYNKFDEMYYSYTMCFDKVYGSNVEGSIILADKNFNYLGEIYNNDYFPYAFTKDYLIDYFPINDSVIEIYYLKLKKTNRNFDEYIESCIAEIQKGKEELSKNDLNNILGEDYVYNFTKLRTDVDTKECKIVTIYGEGCLGCVDRVLEELQMSKEKLNTKDFYVIYSSADQQLINKNIEIYGLRDYKNLIIDSTEIIKNLTTHNGLLNPRITLVKNNKVILDSIFDSFSIESDLIPRILAPVEKHEDTEEEFETIIFENGEFKVL